MIGELLLGIWGAVKAGLLFLVIGILLFLYAWAIARGIRLGLILPLEETEALKRVVDPPETGTIGTPISLDNDDWKQGLEVPCEACSGKGVVSDAPDFKETECRECGGSGRVPYE